MTGRCSPRSCMCSPPGVRGGTCRRRLGCPRRPRIAGSGPGPRRECGPSCTGRSWTCTAPPGIWTGPQRLSTRPASGRKGGELTGPNPVDRGKPGSKLHVLSDATGLPLLVGVSAANTHDSQALQPLVMGHPGHPLPPRTAPTPPGQAARRQGLRLRQPPVPADGQGWAPLRRLVMALLTHRSVMTRDHPVDDLCHARAGRVTVTTTLRLRSA
jgi:hypothetical protein